MLFSYSWLQGFFQQKLPSPQKLAEVLTNHSFETIVKNDKVLDVDVLPNRAGDCLSYQGLAREIGALLDKKVNFPETKQGTNKNLIKTANKISVTVEDQTTCLGYSLKLITGINIQASSPEIQKKLKESGLKPINNVVDLANYVMLETGQPIHVFDLEKIVGGKITVREAKSGEAITTIDGQNYKLKKNILVTADKDGPLVIAGVKGGKRVEVSPETKTILVEAANFSPAVVRKTWHQFGLRTEASWRFENKLSLSLIELAQKRFSYLIEKFKQGTPANDLIQINIPLEKKRTVYLDLDYLNRLLGTGISPKEVKEILNNLGFKITEPKKNTLRIDIPYWRLDVSGPEDLIEEVARIHGYQKLPALAPEGKLISFQENEKQAGRREIKKYLVNTCGLDEVRNYSFISEKEREIFSYKEKELIGVVNPMSNRQKFLRPSLIPGLLKNIQDNEKFFPSFRIFEIGKVFSANELGKEELAGAVVIKEKEKKEGFYEIKGILNSLAESFVITDLKFAPTKKDIPSWGHPNQCADVKIGNGKIGLLSGVHPKILDSLGIKGSVFVFMLNINSFIKTALVEQEYCPISIHPAARRDLSILVPLGTSTEKIIKKINFSGGELIRDVDVFDIYVGENVPTGVKSLSFHLVYQATDRTLQTKEIETLQTKIIKDLEKESGWHIRI